MIHTVRLVLGDQLNLQHSWFKQADDGVLYLLAELKQETDYCRHHIQKVCAFFAAMGEFASALERTGHQVRYLDLDDSCAFADLPTLLDAVIVDCGAQRFEYQRPDEYRLLKQLRQMQLPVPCDEVDSEHFLVPFDELDQHFTRNQAQRMETFYRRMRKRFQVLMDDGKPSGGKWNYDKQNRNPLKPEHFAAVPEPLLFANDISAIKQRLTRHQVDTIGDIGNSLLWPINARQAEQLLDHFCEYLLPQFGRFQDAMSSSAPHRWSLYHARLSFALNCKMLAPLQVIDRAIAAYQQDPAIELAQIEGFVRQILGWREYVRGIYWLNMPQYGQRNHFGASRPLPAWYWNGDTQMHCLSQAIGQSLQYAYAHHIQRLMVTGTFALLTEVDPDEVDGWYLGIYIDAIEWVEMPNTRGMSQFADGGLLASKPYAASGNYINKMSDYCQHCRYKVKSTTGAGACPWNSLYWRFMDKHADELGRNPRTRMVLSHWHNRNPAERHAVLQQAEQYLRQINQL
ncbi:cryptochrome/photolyase family protein [Ferrimonas senticii]|uniref:cryptochrome/photolyase family protein n=1 Tax=Ferrimonas senticii TaxID=394566 RepID=UPI00041CCC5E|nr:cryptochrome/photolyase family protein [Ferrimonas senticii]